MGKETGGSIAAREPVSFGEAIAFHFRRSRRINHTERTVKWTAGDAFKKLGRPRIDDQYDDNDLKSTTVD
jgi:hypothetical protein